MRAVQLPDSSSAVGTAPFCSLSFATRAHQFIVHLLGFIFTDSSCALGAAQSDATMVQADHGSREERAHARRVVVTNAGGRDTYCAVQRLPVHCVSYYSHVAQVPCMRRTALNIIARYVPPRECRQHKKFAL